MQTNARLRIITSFAGLSAIIIVLYGLYASSSSYLGDGIYSPINHFISELGLGSASSKAYVLNNCLIISGMLLFTFIIGLGSYLNSSLKVKAATISGMIATLGYSAVGYFTADTWLPHIIAASVFFFGAMISIALFTWTLWRDQQKRLHPSIVFQGILIAVWYLVALSCPKDLLFQMVNDPENFIRPVWWLLPILEWGYCLMLGTWICMISANLLYQALLELRTNSIAKMQKVPSEVNESS